MKKISLPIVLVVIFQLVILFTVNGQPIITDPSPSSQTHCQTDASTQLSISSTGGIGTVTYQWYSNTANSNIGGTLISGATSTTYTPPTTNAGTLYYYCQATASVDGTATSNTARVIIISSTTISDEQPLTHTETACQGMSASSLIVTATGSGTLTYQWYSNTNFSNSGGSMISSATSFSFSPPVTTAGTFYYYCIVSSSSCNMAISNAFAVTVNPSAAITNPQPQTVCQNTPATPLNVTGSGSGALTYRWYSNTANSNSGGTPISTATNSTYTPPTSTAGTLYYYCTVMSSCGSATSAPAAVVVNSATAISDLQPTAQTICQGSAPTTLTVTASGTGALTYQWYSNTANASTGGTPIGPAMSQAYTPPTTSAGNLYYYCVVSSGCNSATSGTATVTVNPSTTITAQPQSETVCQTAASTALSVTATGTPNLSYQWYTNSSNMNTGGTMITAATNSTYLPPTTTAGTVYYYCTVISSLCNTTTSSATSVLINPLTKITSEPPATLTVCQAGTLSSISTAATGTGTLTYQWYANPVNSNTGGASINGATNTSYTPPTNTASTIYYYCTATSQVCGQAATSTVATTVNPVPAPPFITYAIPNLIPAFCQNTENLNFSLSSTNPTGSVKYGWDITHFTNSTLNQTGSPYNANAILSFGTGGATAIIRATDSFSTGCVSYKDTTIALSSSSAVLDTGRVIWDGMNYVCLNSGVDKYLWGYDDINLVAHTFTASTDAAFVNAQNITLIQNANTTAAATTGHIWCLTTTGSCTTKNYYIDPPAGQQTLPGVSITEPVKIYPNPAAGEVTITWRYTSPNDKTVIILSDIMGRKIMEKPVGAGSIAGTTTLNVSSLKEGMYLVTVLQNNKVTAVGKLIKYQY